MPREEAQEAAKLLFINAGESKEQVVVGYQGWTLCWLQMQSPIFNRILVPGLRGRWLISKRCLISSQKLIPNQPALEQVWGAKLKAPGEGEKLRLAQGQLWKQLITSTDYLQASVNHEERSHTMRIKSSLPAITSSGNERWSDVPQRERER